MRNTTKLSAAALAAAALLAAGCGSSDDKSSSDSASTTPASGKAAPAASTTDISMKSIKFDPKEDTVKVGQAVTWTNDDGVDHNVVATKGADFKSDDFGQGKTYTFKADKAGTIEYTCTLHPGMDGTLIVTK